MTERLQTDGALWRERVTLWQVADPAALRLAVAEAGIPGVTISDRRQDITASLSALKHRVALWLGIGVVAGLGFLALASGAPRATARLALASAGAVGAVVLLLSLSGPLGIFQIMALTLVVGIGVDYGIFLGHGGRAAARSVGLCAGSTLIAFGVMALSPSPIMAQIGQTVSLGVLAMLGVHFARPQPLDPD